MEIPAKIESYIQATYKPLLDPKNKKDDDVLDWYRQLAYCFLQTGIPENGVIELQKKHPISLTWVRRYVYHKPEIVAQNILKYRHDSVEYDSLAKPRIRVTKKKISEFRLNLEKELRGIWGDNKESLEEAIKEYCYQPQDEEIAGFIRRGMKASDWANIIYDYL
jgi:hypothetical protein